MSTKTAVEKAFDKMDFENDKERLEAVVRRAQLLQPLKTSAAFDEFMQTIAEDLEGFERKRDGAVEFIDIIEYRALAVYAKNLRGRVDTYLNNAKEASRAIEEDKQEEEKPGHSVY